MSRGLLPYFLDNGIPVLIAAAVVLLGGMGYGVYVSHQRAPTPVAAPVPAASAPVPAPAVAPAATPP